MVVGGSSTSANSDFIGNSYWKLYDAFTVAMVTQVDTGTRVCQLGQI